MGICGHRGEGGNEGDPKLGPGRCQGCLPQGSPPPPSKGTLGVHRWLTHGEELVKFRDLQCTSPHPFRTRLINSILAPAPSWLPAVPGPSSTPLLPPQSRSPSIKRAPSEHLPSPHNAHFIANHDLPLTLRDHPGATRGAFTSQVPALPCLSQAFAVCVGLWLSLSLILSHSPSPSHLRLLVPGKPFPPSRQFFFTLSLCF